MVDYVRLAATAARLLGANGVPVILNKALADDYDPSTGTVDAFGAKTYNGYAVRNGSPSLIAYQQTAEPDSQVAIEEIELFVSMPDAIPAFGDTLTMDGHAWKIHGVTPIAPGPVTLLYEVSARA